MKISILGSRFDPPHNGHIQIARNVIKNGLADEVWLMPCYQHPFDKKMISAAHRLAMLETLIEPGISISTYEIDKKTISYSYETLKDFSKINPENEYSWIIGTDNLKNFHKWKDFEKLLEKFKVFVYPRKGYDPTPLYPGMIFLKDFEEIDVSSTLVRNNVALKNPIDSFVAKPVAEYINYHNLYL
jgi:nicotinate-nucleotide adenylyltransferase